MISHISLSSKTVLQLLLQLHILTLGCVSLPVSDTLGIFKKKNLWSLNNEILISELYDQIIEDFFKQVNISSHDWFSNVQF